jgi:RHS repeat-associated protein
MAITGQPDLLTGKYENGWLGQHQRMTDTTDAANPVVDVGARVYLPRLAKFTSVDPIEAGVGDADYLYPTDPINRNDLTGRDIHNRRDFADDDWYSEGGWIGQQVVRVFISDDSLVDVFFEGAARWSATGVTFVRVAKAADADLSVGTNGGNCPKYNDGTGAYACEIHSQISVNLSTIPKDKGTQVDVMAHEIGHYFGFADGQPEIMKNPYQWHNPSETYLASVRKRVKG